MNVNSIFSYYNVFESGNADPASNRRKSENSVDGGSSDRNTGPDTVTFSSEAIAQYAAMKSGSNSSDTNGNDAYSSFSESLLGQSHESSKKNKKMSTAELLAFMKSDNFAKEAIGYAKAVTTASTTSEDDDSATDELMNSIGSNKNKKPSSVGNDDSDSLAVEEKTKNSSEVAFVNGKRGTEQELNKKIHEVEEDVKDLTATYELVMNGEGSIEEKTRMSQPIHKRLQERLEELQSLKAQKQMLAEAKMDKMDMMKPA